LTYWYKGKKIKIHILGNMNLLKWAVHGPRSSTFEIHLMKFYGWEWQLN